MKRHGDYIFYTNLDKEDKWIYEQVGKNLKLDYIFRDDATTIDGVPIPSCLAFYVNGDRSMIHNEWRKVKFRKDKGRGDMRVGDEVRIITTNVEGILDGKLSGKIGKITEIIGGTYPYRIACDGYHVWCEAEPLTPENQSGRFKVGDAVKVFGTRKCNGTGIGTVLNIEDNNALYVKIDGSKWYVHPDDAELIKESTMPTCKDDKYEYTALKSLSPKSLLDASPCNLEFDKYCRKFGYHNEPVLEDVIRACADNSAWLPWLKFHGYVGVKSLEKKYEILRGDKYKIEGCTYLACYVDGLVLIDLDRDVGHFWNSPVSTNCCATEFKVEHFKQALGHRGYDFEKIYATRVPFKGNV